MKTIIQYLFVALLSMMAASVFSSDQEPDISCHNLEDSDVQTSNPRVLSTKKIRECFLNSDFEGVLEELLTTDHDFYVDQPHELLGDAYTIVYCYLMLDQYQQAEDYIYELTSKPEYAKISGIYSLRGWVDCFNDNYGKALDSFSLEIINQLKKMTQGDTSGASELFISYINEASVYAVKGMKHEVCNDLESANFLRKNFSYLPQEKLVVEHILKKFLEDDTDSVVVYRIKDFKSMPYMANKETGEVGFGMKLMWWSNISDSDEELLKLKESQVMETPLGEFRTTIFSDNVSP